MLTKTQAGIKRIRDDICKEEVEHYIQLFKKLLKKKYGKTVIDKLDWKTDSMSNYIERNGSAVKYGYLKYRAAWRTEETLIIIRLHEIDWEPRLQIIYESRKLSGLKPVVNQDEL